MEARGDDNESVMNTKMNTTISGKRVLANGLTDRRVFLRGAATLAACAFFPKCLLGDENAALPAARPNSVFNGVRIGAITYSYRGYVPSLARDTLNALLRNGLSEVELMGEPINAYAGLGGGRPTDAQREAQLAKCKELRKMYNDAGVNIHMHRRAFGRSDEDIDFNFQVANALGCVGIALERSEDMAKRLGPFADKHKIWVAFHNHTSNCPSIERLDPILGYGQYIGFNFDVGHYFVGMKGLSPIAVIERYHDRMVSLHLKDRTADGGDRPFGEGGTPVKEILQLMRQEKWTFPADIELEYPIPRNSNPVSEVTKCVQFCKEALA
jgi:sugar phosphate isomerase/epimerase